MAKSQEAHSTVQGGVVGVRTVVWHFRAVKRARPTITAIKQGEACWDRE